MTGTTGFARVGRAGDLGETGLLAVTLADGTRVCLVRTQDGICAVADACPHRQFALSSGELVADGVLECAWHGAQFDVRTGAAVTGPATDTIATYAVQLIDGDIFVQSPS